MPASSARATPSGSASAGPLASASTSATAVDPPAPSAARTTSPPQAVTLEKPPDACTVIVVSWPHEPTDVSLRPGGPPFASLYEAPVTLVMPRAPEANAWLQVGAGMLVAAFSLPRDSVPVYPKRPLLAGGFLVPMAGYSAPWQGTGKAGELALTFDASEHLSRPASVTERVRCDAIALEPPSYDGAAFAAHGPSSGSGSIVQAAPLATTPDGAPVAELRASERVETFETRSGRTRIVLQAARYALVGWVPATAIGRALPSSSGFADGNIHFAADGLGIGEALVCPTDVALFGEVGGERSALGAIHKGNELWAAELASARDDDFVTVTLATPWLALAEGAHWLVRAAELRACHPAASP